ncbi:MAG: hypothetical protein IT385_24775 [Deltaproteobacteria bacterium]|nr:hypothetical protein [Deltaproteobacteria bacterium]
MEVCGLFEVVLDLRGSVLAIGARLATLAGATPAELIGRPIVKILRGAALTGPAGQVGALEVRAEGRQPTAGFGLRTVDGDRVHVTFLPEPPRTAAAQPAQPPGPPAPSTGPDPRLVTEVVRELHDPLTGITGFAALAQIAATPHRRKYYLDQVTSQAERVRRLAQSLDRAFLSRPPLVGPVELATELARVIGASRVALERHGIAFEMTKPSSLWVSCDARQIGDMVVALIHRGTLAQRRDYQANEVTLTLASSGGEATITLVFTGADQPAVLLRERFGLGDEGTQTPSEFELEAAQRALERQGGACRVTADRAAESVRVVVTLPLVTSPPRLDPLRTPVPLDVLVIDDDAMIGELYSELLGASGHTVTPCRSLYAALDALRQQRFDAVIAEFQLKDGQLSELWAEAAAQHPEIASRLLVVTRDPRDARLREWAGPQGARVLAKPFSPTQLLDQLGFLTQ